MQRHNPEQHRHLYRRDNLKPHKMNTRSAADADVHITLHYITFPKVFNGLNYI
jgi:hypothetical protein